ncbi:tortifolia1-like protein 3 [Tanacetum coccineum]
MTAIVKRLRDNECNGVREACVEAVRVVVTLVEFVTVVRSLVEVVGDDGEGDEIVEGFKGKGSLLGVVVKSLVEFLGSEDWLVRKRAVSALGKLVVGEKGRGSLVEFKAGWVPLADVVDDVACGYHFYYVVAAVVQSQPATWQLLTSLTVQVQVKLTCQSEVVRWSEVRGRKKSRLLEGNVLANDWLRKEYCSCNKDASRA